MLLVSSVLALVGGEFAYRLLRTGRLGPTTNPTYVLHDVELGWSYRPDAQVRHVSAEFDVEIAINSHGFRDSPWPARAEGRKLLLVLGDSFAFGWGVEAQQRASSLLAEALPAWDVRNAAVSGYGTDQQLLLLRKLQPELRPDAVLVLFCPNDLDESAVSLAYGHRKPWFKQGEGGVLVACGQPVPQPWIESFSHLAQAIGKQLSDRGRANRPRDAAGEWSLVLGLFQEMTSAAAGAPLILLSATDELAAFAAERPGVWHVDERPLLAPLGASANYPVDGHWKAAGHAAVAAGLVSLIEKLQ